MIRNLNESGVVGTEFGGALEARAVSLKALWTIISPLGLLIATVLFVVAGTTDDLQILNPLLA
jgi:hypothetical protein